MANHVATSGMLVIGLCDVTKGCEARLVNTETW
jgi:hypothetical protein